MEENVLRFEIVMDYLFLLFREVLDRGEELLDYKLGFVLREAFVLLSEN